MSTFDEARIRRAGDGKFATKGLPEADPNIDLGPGPASLGEKTQHLHIVVDLLPGAVLGQPRISTSGLRQGA